MTVAPGTVFYAGRAQVYFIREDGECGGPEFIGWEMLAPGAGDGSSPYKPGCNQTSDLA